MNYDWNKTVSITVPTGTNGWVNVGSVTINGITVTFPIGKPATVPEPVAALLTAMITATVPDEGNPHHEPFMQMVTDANGDPTWEPRLAYKYTTEGEVVNLPPTELLGIDEDGVTETAESFMLATPWSVELEPGKTYDVAYNGVAYACPALLYTEGGMTGLVLGNTDRMGMPGGNPNAPFFMLCFPNSMQADDWPWVGMLMPFDGATAVTLAVSHTTGSTQIKPIDPELLPPEAKRTPITLTIAEDGTVTSDTDFETAWAMDAAVLQTAVVINQGKSLLGMPVNIGSSVSQVRKGEISGSARVITIQYEEPILDPSDNPSPTTRYIDWQSYAGQESIVRSGYCRPEMPIVSGPMDVVQYLRWSYGRWLPITLDQLKADLGLT